MDLYAVIHNNINQFFLGVGGKGHGAFHIARVVSAIKTIAFHNITSLFTFKTIHFPSPKNIRSAGRLINGYKYYIVAFFSHESRV